MTRALVTQLVEALEASWNPAIGSLGREEKANAAITAAREYLATEPKPTLKETLAQQGIKLRTEFEPKQRDSELATEPSGERAKVGDSRFESWYSELQQSGKGSKQVAREAYEAGLNEADAQQVAVTSGERAELIAAHQELNMSNYGPDDVDELNHWANRAYDMLEADVSLINEGNKAQQVNQDKARLDWLEQNLFNRENLTLQGKVCKDYNMWVMFSPVGVQGSARTIIDAAMAKEKP